MRVGRTMRSTEAKEERVIGSWPNFWFAVSFFTSTYMGVQNVFTCVQSVFT